MRRHAAPIVERCQAPGCDGLRRRSQSLCQRCFERLPRDLRRDMAVARESGALREVAKASREAREWLGAHPAGSVAEDVNRQGRDERARWWDR